MYYSEQIEHGTLLENFLIWNSQITMKHETEALFVLTLEYGQI
jgi:hypothetical protein